MKQLTTINVYLIARISQDAHEWNRKVCAVFAKPFTVFLPQEHNPWNTAHDTIPQEVYAADIHAMEQAHIGLLLPDKFFLRGEFRNGSFYSRARGSGHGSFSVMQRAKFTR